jgi:membrane-bound metal-dependent hydrolase YbcI (DUF457 family)
MRILLQPSYKPIRPASGGASPKHGTNMEPVTHALTSFALGRAGLNKVNRMATPMLLASGLLADVDWFSKLGGPRVYLHSYRTATHSLLGTLTIVVILGLAFWLVGRKVPTLRVSLGLAFLICAIGAASHLLLDLLNPYGVKLLWPFDGKWYGFDLASDVDGWIIFFLIVGLLTPELFRLVLQEIGSKPNPHGRRRGAIWGLAIVLIFIAARAVFHHRAIALLDAREYRSQTPLVVGAFPHPSTPLDWSGVVETDNAMVNVDVPLGFGNFFDPEDAAVHFKPEPSQTLESALKSAAAVEFISFARFPLANVEPFGDGYEVRIRDMRYASRFPGRRGIFAVINLNAQNQVIGERLAFDDESRFGIF